MAVTVSCCSTWMCGKAGRGSCQPRRLARLLQAQEALQEAERLHNSA